MPKKHQDKRVKRAVSDRSSIPTNSKLSSSPKPDTIRAETAPIHNAGIPPIVLSPIDAAYRPPVLEVFEIKIDKTGIYQRHVVVQGASAVPITIGPLAPVPQSPDLETRQVKLKDKGPRWGIAFLLAVLADVRKALITLGVGAAWTAAYLWVDKWPVVLEYLGF